MINEILTKHLLFRDKLEKFIGDDLYLKLDNGPIESFYLHKNVKSISVSNSQLPRINIESEISIIVLKNKECLKISKDTGISSFSIDTIDATVIGKDEFINIFNKAIKNITDLVDQI